MPRPTKPKSAEKPYLFVDLANLVYRNASVLHFLKTKDGTPTGGVYGTIRALLSYSKSFKVWVFADGANTNRRDLMGGYKANRPDTMIQMTFPEPPKIAVPDLSGLLYTGPESHVAPTFSPALPSSPVEEQSTPVETSFMDELVAMAESTPPPAPFITKEFVETHIINGSEEPGGIMAISPELLAEVESEPEFTPEYKSLKGMVWNNMDELVNHLTAFGFPLLYNEESEADDLIGAAVYHVRKITPDRQIYILSADKDFDQLPADRITFMKAHAKYATGRSPIKDTFLMGAGTLAPFSEIPDDAWLRKFPHLVPVYRALAGDKSDNIKHMFPPSKLWNKKKGPTEDYLADTLVKDVYEFLVDCGGDPSTYLGFVEAINTLLWEPDLVDPNVLTLAKGISQHLSEDEALTFAKNITVTKVPINLRTSSELTSVSAHTPNGTFTTTLKGAINICGGVESHPEFDGWHVDHATISEFCTRFQMPSIIKALVEIDTLTIP